MKDEKATGKIGSGGHIGGMEEEPRHSDNLLGWLALVGGVLTFPLFLISWSLPISLFAVLFAALFSMVAGTVAIVRREPRKWLGWLGGLLGFAFLVFLWALAKLLT